MENSNRKIRFTPPPLYKCIVVLCVSVVAVFTSCGLFGGDADGYGNVRVTFENSARNVTQADKDNSTIRVYFDGSPVEQKGGVYEMRVEVGTHLKITAEAVTQDGRVVGKGEENIIVKNGTNNVPVKIFTYDKIVVTDNATGKSLGFSGFDSECYSAIDGQNVTVKFNESLIIPDTFMLNSGTVTVDLNGKTLSYVGNQIAIQVAAGTLTIKDTAGGGAIDGSMATPSNAGPIGFYVNGTLNLASGKICNFKGGSGVYVMAGTFNMTGGEISGNSGNLSAYGGGGVLVQQGTFNMTGGIITKNEAVASNQAFSPSGGGVLIYNNSSYFNFNKDGGNGVITGNTAGSGKNICVQADSWYNGVQQTNKYYVD